MNLESLDESENFIIGWQYRRLGHFKTALAELMCLADDENLIKLSLGFPNEVRGYEKYAKTPGWWKKVQKKAGIEKEE